MKCQEIAYYDSDESYGRKLSGYISKRKGLPFRFRTFFDREYFSDYLIKEKPPYLLISESAMEIVPQNYMGRKILILEEERMTADSMIYKYQSGEKILKQLLSIYYEGKEGRKSYQDLKGKYILGIYSPIRRCGKSQFAAAMAQVMGETGSTLLLILDNRMWNPRLSAGEESESGRIDDLSDLIFYYREFPGRFLQKLPLAVTKMGNFDCIYPAKRIEDLFQVSMEEWEELVAMIGTAGGYETVVLDISQEVKGYQELLDLCHVIYMPVLNDTESDLLVKQCKKRLREEGSEELCSKIICVHLPEEESEEKGEEVKQIVSGSMEKFVRGIRTGKITEDIV